MGAFGAAGAFGALGALHGRRSRGFGDGFGLVIVKLLDVVDLLDDHRCFDLRLRLRCLRLRGRLRRTRVLGRTTRATTHRATEDVVFVVLVFDQLVLEAVALVFVIVVLLVVVGTIPEGIAAFGGKAVAILLVFVVRRAAVAHIIHVVIHQMELPNLVATRHDASSPRKSSNAVVVRTGLNTGCGDAARDTQTSCAAE
ncbi:hypothetical protein [Gemmatimonas groenlandica]|uniref:Uncharacterized protein n=1 Tax=Gemmatimonas groenlandica TaxID=2732249 RepID=A0A6M4IWR7_9BACT|nr:hypothetical protein [Gemmatimonas groenlandica]QJR36631.1 hypothetical protein HKW67_14495 [Gemmatimonas groenlandica]